MDEANAEEEAPFAATHECANGTKQTSRRHQSMSAFGGKGGHQTKALESLLLTQSERWRPAKVGQARLDWLKPLELDD